MLAVRGYENSEVMVIHWTSVVFKLGAKTNTFRKGKMQLHLRHPAGGGGKAPAETATNTTTQSTDTAFNLSLGWRGACDRTASVHCALVYRESILCNSWAVRSLNESAPTARVVHMWKSGWVGWVGGWRQRAWVSWAGGLGDGWTGREGWAMGRVGERAGAIRIAGDLRKALHSSLVYRQYKTRLQKKKKTIR